LTERNTWLTDNLKDMAFKRLYLLERCVEAAWVQIGQAAQVAGLSSEDLALRAGLTTKRLHEIMQHPKTVSLAALVYLAQALDLEVVITFKPLRL
jgi:hypothetical protein